MTTEEFEALIQGADESIALEFKGPMLWAVNSLVKDILAMANIIDGGHIVFGIEDETNARLGLSEEQDLSFNLDIMRDQVAPFADPAVDFQVHHVIGGDSLRFTVIRVEPFREIPVICKIDRADVHAGTIYYRSLVGRAASARVSNANDLREIIEIAIARRLAALQRVGIVPAPQAYDFETELGDLA